MHLSKEEEFAQKAFEIVKTPWLKRGIFLLGLDPETKQSLIEVGKLYHEMEKEDEL